MKREDAPGWERVAEVFSEALELSGARRSAFLDDVCEGDPHLRREVESLLAHHQEDGFLDRPGLEWVPDESENATEAWAPDRFGRFEVVSKLGAGGMGEVYVAFDPTLRRKVALKLLPAHLAGDPERLRRFRREALAVSALNHPNILTVHEILDLDERMLLVSELVEGETLRSRLRRGPLPVATGLDLGIQLARALAAAHEVGIVHRDVKPENVMIRPDGLVKLLDFGLAKPLKEETSETAPGTAWSTDAGRILGTAPYMSPEQARGDPSGRQTDVWALGCVLYEALAGRQAFRGRTVSDVLASVLTGDPDWEALPADTPSLARSLFRRCLQKDPERRMRDVEDVRIELEEALHEPEPIPGGPHGRSGWLPWVAAGLVTAVALVVAANLPRPEAPSPGPVRFELQHPTGGRFYSSVESSAMAISPDGSRLAFITLGPSATSIWIRALGELEARPLAGPENASSVVWSPDGRSLAFVADGKLKRVALAGGAPVVVCDVEVGRGVSGTWAGSTILFASIEAEAIYRVPADGGTPAVVLRPDASRAERRVGWPWLLPDAERFLYLARREDGTTGLRLATLETGESRSVAQIASRVELVDPDLLVFVKEGALVAQRFDPDRGVLFGPPLPLVPEVRAFGSSLWAGFATSRSGTVVVATRDDLHQVSLVDADGNVVERVGSLATTNFMATSPGGRRAIVDRLRPGLSTWDLWTLDLERGVETQLTHEPGTEVFATWHPDERTIVYTSTSAASGSPNLLRRDLSTGRDEKVVPPGQFQIPLAITPDGRRVLYRERSQLGFELYEAPLDGSSPPARLLRPGLPIRDAALSPDGRILAYVSSEAGRPELFVRLLEGGEAIRVSENGAWTVRFAPEGETLFFTTFDRRLAAVAVSSEPGLEVGAPEVRFDLHELGWGAFDVLSDGRFVALVRERDGTREPLTVITGWNRRLDQ